MGKFEGILICSDLDGTLFKNDKTISKKNAEAIEYFKSEGGSFTFITGRLPYYVVDAYNSVKPNVPFICINGGGIYDGLKGEYISYCEISLEVMGLIQYIDESFSDLGIQVCAPDKTYFARENDLMKDFRGLTGLPNIVAHYLDVKPPISKIIFGSYKEEVILEIEKMLKAHPLAFKFDFIRSERTLFEILPKGVSKSYGLMSLTEYLGIDINKTIAIGDYYNDVSMLKTAGVGIAVANACDEAIKAADYVTVSNEESAIAKVISDLDRGYFCIEKSKK